jgi:hypothetical protein
MNSPAVASPPRHGRSAIIVAGVLALLGSFMVTAPAHAGYYGESYSGPGSYYGSRPCSYRCGYGYSRPYRYYGGGCSSCGCYRRCHSGSRGLIYERRYVEREFVERRYGWSGSYGRHYGYSPYYGGYRSSFPYGYGGVRSWRSPYGYQYGGPSAYQYAAEPRPPAPIPYGYEGEQY